MQMKKNHNNDKEIDSELFVLNQKLTWSLKDLIQSINVLSHVTTFKIDI